MNVSALSDRRLAPLVEAGVSLASELDLSTLLRRIADAAREVIGASYGAVGVLNSGGELADFVYSGIDDATAARIGGLPTGRGVLGAVIEQGAPLRLSEIAGHARSFGFPEHHPDMHTFLGVPIVVRGNVFGRLYVTEKAGGAEFTRDDERIALMLAAQAGVAIENARLNEAVRDMAVLEERERISKELHDGVIQAVYSVGLSLQGAMSLATRDPDAVVKRMDDAITQLDDVVRGVRNYIFELRPARVRERGFRAALEDFAAGVRRNAHASVLLHLDDGALASLSTAQEAQVVQVLREILSNVARHSAATEVSVRCVLEGGVVVFHVLDDGIGFDRDDVTEGDGLRNMEGRMSELGGELQIARGENGGTAHRVLVPIEGQIDLT